MQGLLSTPHTQNGIVEIIGQADRIKKYYDPIHGYIELDEK